jgi:hypothetical protein
MLPSRFRLMSSTRPRFTLTSFEDFAIRYLSFEMQVEHKAIATGC